MADLACYQRDQCVVDTTELLKAYMMMGIKTKEVMVDMLKAVNSLFNAHSRSPQELVSSNFSIAREMGRLLS
jgi:hypothetical protein